MSAPFDARVPHGPLEPSLLCKGHTSALLHLCQISHGLL